MRRHILSALPRINDSTARIESAFLETGRGLNEGLAMFKALNGSLSGLAGELETGAAAEAAGSLDRLSRAMVEISAQLPRDAETLAALVAANHKITTRFGGLSDRMRMMTIISRSARIEAVSFDDANLGLESFTRAIGQQIGDVQRDINTCAADHDKLTQLLRGSAQTQCAFEADYRDRLVALAGELSAAFDVIRQRREDGGGLMRDAAARSGRITRAVGMALVAFQVGDATRQRLEHVSLALDHAAGLGEHDAGDPQAAAAALCHIQDAQLRDTAAAFEGEAAEVLQALALVADETRDLVAVGTATYGQGTEGAESFMTGFRARFATAIGLVQTCEAIRQSVQGAIDELHVMLGTLSSTIETLGDTSRDLVLVGMNVGLKAARLGPDGRSLVVVAEELKRLASQIAMQTQELLPVFDEIHTVSRRFGGERVLGAGQLDDAFRTIVDDLERGDGRIADLLQSLTATGRRFELRLDEARDTFGTMTAINAVLIDVADDLREGADATGVSDARLAGGLTIADALLQPVYTMARERDIHATVAAPWRAASDDALDDTDDALAA